MITPPFAVGMLGGGQLGRYALLAARTAGYRTIVLDPDPLAPAGAVADRHLIAAFDDADALAELGATCAVVTTEFENPPAASLAALAAVTTVAPAERAVAIAQDRRAEKEFLDGAGIAVAEWCPLERDDDLDRAAAIGSEVVVKSQRLGYDGKGQVVVEAADRESIDAAWTTLGRQPCVVERRLPLDLEISVVIARGVGADVAAYAVAENHHVGGVLSLSVAPARVDGAISERAVTVAAEIASTLGYVGVLAVEFFVAGGTLVVNELAPRPHNSGHWTLDAAATSQFAQQIRAVTGSALGPVTMTAPAAAMVNLLGDLWWPADADPGIDSAIEPDWAAVLAEPAATLHLYGKATPRPGRKMGHLTVRAETASGAAELAASLRATAGRL